jgi:hypothetical protein
MLRILLESDLPGARAHSGQAETAFNRFVVDPRRCPVYPHLHLWKK